MTLRERLHHQIDALDAEQLAALDALLTQLTRPQRLKNTAAATPLPAPFLRAQRLMAGQPGFAQDIIDSREDRG
ncbi:MAG: hypothetical protein V4540_17090 [Pseudomonadota bacterium]|jgi:hypothetical protein